MTKKRRNKECLILWIFWIVGPRPSTTPIWTEHRNLTESNLNQTPPSVKNLTWTEQHHLSAWTKHQFCKFKKNQFEPDLIWAKSSIWLQHEPNIIRNNAAFNINRIRPEPNILCQNPTWTEELHLIWIWTEQHDLSKSGLNQTSSVANNVYWN